jgi:hypothetical protein
MASTYLTRNPGSAGNRQKWTFSAWVKRAGLGSAQAMFTAGFSANNVDTLQFDATDQISWFSYDGNTDYAILTNAKFRDVNAWYHIQAVLDTGNATANDRVILYVNGERQSLATNTMPSQNYNGIFNNNSTAHYIGQYGWNSNAYFDGEMSHVNFSDGYALAPTVFGSTDSTTGEWKINTSPSFTLGTNGFTILKDGNTITDQSSNSNNWTVAAGTLTKTEDCPSNVFCTLNPLNQTNSGYVFSNGNTKGTVSGAWLGGTGTLAMSSGKYYWEVKYGSGNYGIGLAGWGTPSTKTSDVSDANYGYIGRYTGGYELFQNSGQPYKLNASTNNGNYGTQATAGDIIMVAFDADNSKLYTGLNGTWNNSSDPANGTSPMYTVTSGYAYTPSASIETGSLEFNFGNGKFGTTSVSSAGTNASGNGIFEYNVPAGFTALSTKGLNL